jgi:serine/threonine protein kinase
MMGRDEAGMKEDRSSGYSSLIPSGFGQPKNPDQPVLTEAPSNHPDDEALRALSLGQLTETELAHISAHLGDCPACCRRIDQLATDDSLVARLQQGAAGSAEMLVSPTQRRPAVRALAQSQPERSATQERDAEAGPVIVPAPRQVADYEILGPLGKGGMGEVLRGRDVKLDRRVAIKVLPDALANDPVALARFDREARLLAALNHPNVATVYGLHEVQGKRCIVMELVPGETLAQRLIGGPLPLDEAFQVGRQIAEALEAAHDRGIIHRDLKPANVMLTPEGKVKVLDFGLAKSTQPTEAATDTVNQLEGQTGEGVILGTPAYMAPEQARGRPVDRRCDLWALGCVLFESLTGRKVFRGKTFQDMLAAIIEDSPDWDGLPSGVPPRVVDLLRRCLEKGPQRRLRDAGYFRLELEDALAELGREPSSSPRAAPTRSPAAPAPARRRWRWWPALAAAAVALAAFALGRWYQPPPSPLPPPQAPKSWSGQALLMVEAATYVPRVSPDGKWLAFVVIHENQAQVGVMKLDSCEWWVLTRNRDRGQVLGVSWANDSTRIFFDRYNDVPTGVFSASPLDRVPEGAREVPVVKDAACPHVTGDGSLIVVKRDAAGNDQMHVYSPGQPLRPVGPPAEFERGWTAPIRALHTCRKVVFCGKVMDGKAPPTRRFYLLDLDTNEYRPLGDGEVGVEFMAFAISWRDDFLYTVSGRDDAFHVVRLPLAGSFTPEPLLTLTTSIYGIDVDPEDRIYLDQYYRPMGVLRFDPAGDDRAPAVPLPVERLTGPMLWRETAAVALPLELPDGRLLVPTKVAGRDRLVMALLGKEEVPLLLDSREETSLPAIRLGKDRLAFSMGSGRARRLRLATLEAGGARLEDTDLGIQSASLDALASTPDGKTLYFVQTRQVYQVPTDGSKPAQKVEAGDAVAVEPATGALLIERFEGSGNRLFRLPRPGGQLKAVPVEPGSLRLAPVPLAGAAIHPDGRVLVTTAAPNSCHWQTAVLGPEGKLQPLPVNFNGDVIPAGWSKDGKVLAIGFGNFADLWRFTPRSPR